MPSFGDTALIALIALLLFGPKKLPELARQLGKLMGEFRRASNEFRMQMEDELRLSEQADRQKQIAAMEAAAPITPPLLQDESLVVEHPHMPPALEAENTIAAPTDAVAEAEKPERHTSLPEAAPLPIASSGNLDMMPPATGLPVGRNGASPLGPMLDAIPHAPEPEAAPEPTHEPSMADLDPIDRARQAVSDRVELPGMSLMEHLGELRKRLLHSVAYLVIGFAVAYAFHERLYGIIQAPLDQLHIALNFTHPTDGLNLYLKTSFVGGCILASPFILYQLWLFISPGMYAHEKRYVWPFMFATIGLFLAGVWFGYHWVMPGAIKVLIFDFGKKFHPILTIEDYTSFFMSVILGLGICFELPILIFFLALFGIVDGKFLLKHFRYAVLAIFLISAIICPLQDPFSMCLFASPMLALYFLGVGVAFLVHPARRKAKETTAA